MTKSNVSDYDLIYRGETPMAVKVSRDTDAPPFWLPKSQIEFDEGIDRKRGDAINVAIPDWLAEKHDLTRAV